MKSNPKTESSIDYLVDAEYELEQDTGSSHIAVLIKHDYYSSDDEHGRALLRSFLDSLRSGSLMIDTVFLIGSGVRLADPGNDLNSALAGMIADCSAGTVYICSESKEYYDISSNIDLTSASSSDIFGMISWMISEGDRIITIE